MAHYEALLIQNAILWFTLGMLAGLPTGYWIGWVADPQNLPRMVLRVLIGLHIVDKNVSDLVAYTELMDIDAMRRAA